MGFFEPLQMVKDWKDPKCPKCNALFSNCDKSILYRCYDHFEATWELVYWFSTEEAISYDGRELFYREWDKVVKNEYGNDVMVKDIVLHQKIESVEEFIEFCRTFSTDSLLFI